MNIIVNCYKIPWNMINSNKGCFWILILLPFIRSVCTWLTVTKVVFEFRVYIVFYIYVIWLTVTKVVFEYTALEYLGDLLLD